MTPTALDSVRSWLVWADQQLTRYLDTGELSHLVVARQALASAPTRTEQSFYRNFLLTTHSKILRALAEQLDDRQALDEAVAAGEQAMDTALPGDPNLHRHLSCLAAALADRHERTNSVADLQRSEALYRVAVNLAPEAERPAIRSDLSTVLHTRYEDTADIAILDEAIELCRASLDQADNDDQGDRHFQLACLLFARYEHGDELGLLDEAVDLARHTVAVTGPRSHHRPLFLTKLSGFLGVRARRLNSEQDDIEAGRHIDEALSLTPERHYHRAGLLLHAGDLRVDRYRRTGRREHLDAAISHYRTSIDLVATTDLNHPVALSNLANALHEHYRAFGGATVLDEVVDLHRRATEGPAAGSERPMRLSRLAMALLDRATLHRRDNRNTDGAAALSAARAAVDQAPTTAASRGSYLNSLVCALLDSHDRSGDLGASAEAEQLCRRFLEAPSSDRQHVAAVADNLVTVLMRRSERGDDLAAAEAESLARTALAQALPGDQTREQARHTMAWVLTKRYRRTDTPADRAEAVHALHDLGLDPTVTAVRRVQALAGLGRAIAETGDWAAATTWYQLAADLVSEAVPMAWTYLDRQHGLGEFFTLAADGAACALNAGNPGLALELLEQGRGALVGHQLYRHEDLAQLRRHAPEPAERFERLEEQLRALQVVAPSPSTSHAGLDDAMRRHELRNRFDAVLTEIRRRPPLNRFLRGPSHQELVEGIGDGPVVVVNVSRFRCDALLVADHSLRVLPLPGLDEADVARRLGVLQRAVQAGQHEPAESAPTTRAVHEVLGWLWDTVAEPVLGALGHTGALPSGAVPRKLWWCPTGYLTFFPIHAAGHHGRTRPRDNRSVHDQVVSCYTPTVRALLQRGEARPAPNGRPSALVVGLSATPGHGALPNAVAEAQAVAAQLPNSTLLLDQQATRDRILAGLGEHTWLHFAGHAAQDPVSMTDPVLVPYDHRENGPITATDLAGLGPIATTVAFLSACETAGGRITLPDEATHVGGVLLTAGVAHVIAAQWQVPDRDAAQVALEFYRQLHGGTTDPAVALHLAIHRIRSRQKLQNRTADARSIAEWAAFVHFGR